MEQERILIKGNEAVAYAAVAAGCQCYFGYPITPQSEIPEMLSHLLPESGGDFVQAESEIAAVNMLLGAGACGVRAMTSSSSPGISLMQECISYMVGSEIPGVIVNMTRGGPGLGSIDASQADYFQSTKGGAHGGARTFVLAPSTCQECYDMTIKAFSLAFIYRNPVLILGDAMVAQVKEPVVCWKPEKNLEDKADSWRLNGNKGRNSRLLRSVNLKEGGLAEHNNNLLRKYLSMQQDIEAEEYLIEDAKLVVVAFGSIGRIARSAINTLREQGYKVGLFRPLTLFPYPSSMLEALAKQGKNFFVIEQNGGQMVEDVRLAIRHYTDANVHLVPIGVSIGAEDLLQPISEYFRRI